MGERGGGVKRRGRGVGGRGRGGRKGEGWEKGGEVGERGRGGRKGEGWEKGGGVGERGRGGRKGEGWEKGEGVGGRGRGGRKGEGERDERRRRCLGCNMEQVIERTDELFQPSYFIGQVSNKPLEEPYHYNETVVFLSL